MGLTVVPCTPVIGAEISGADLTRTDPQEYQAIRELLVRHQVLFFRDQPRLEPGAQVAWARQFGGLHSHPAAPTMPGHPEIFVIRADANSKVANGHGWHSDVSCDEEPPMATMLQIHHVPESGGGDTLFNNMFAAFETLSEPMQRFLCGLSAHHESEHIYRGRYSDRGVDDAGRTYPACLHPVVRTHEEADKQALFVNPSFTTRIEGLAANESRALLNMLFEHQQRPEFQVRFRWTPNAVALWDNRSTQHFALWDYWPATREGHRVTIAGTRPVHRELPLCRRKMRLSRKAL
ncbi:MAG: TauD/TfdA family dioxygenase [Pseudomonadales bacterium]|nr:TauD/TfdA family dioxygenase [Pseudomonadales bacterium]MCP5183246.1 TauD/TfdA family dioxygenase [Pseudomonadales bacterium]